MNHFEDYTVIDKKFDYSKGEEYCYACGKSLDENQHTAVVENATQIYYYHVRCYVPRPGQAAPTNQRSADAYATVVSS